MSLITAFSSRKPHSFWIFLFKQLYFKKIWTVIVKFYILTAGIIVFRAPCSFVQICILMGHHFPWQKDDLYHLSSALLSVIHVILSPALDSFLMHMNWSVFSWILQEASCRFQCYSLYPAAFSLEPGLRSLAILVSLDSQVHRYDAQISILMWISPLVSAYRPSPHRAQKQIQELS